MATKQIEVPEIGTVTFYKRRNARSIKISLGHGDQVRVSLPTWMPYRAGLEYLKSKTTWVLNNRQAPLELTHGSQIGKAHRIFYYPTSSSQINSRVTATEIRITHPLSTPLNDVRVQDVAKRASLRALRHEAEVLLPQRLNQIAQQFGYSYKGVSIKKLRSRWGSCSQHKHIALNIFLIQLPWPLIDYVLVHELTHTEHLNHSPDFWKQVGQCLPNYKQLRKELKAYHPAI